MLTHHLGSNTWDTQKVYDIMQLFGEIARRINPEFQPMARWLSADEMVYTFSIYYPVTLDVFTEEIFEQIIREIENKLSIMFFKVNEFYDVLDDIDTDPCPEIKTENLAKWHRCELCTDSPRRVPRISKSNLDKLLVRA